MSNKEAVRRLLLLLGKYKKTIVVIVGCLLVSTNKTIIHDPPADQRHTKI